MIDRKHRNKYKSKPNVSDDLRDTIVEHYKKIDVHPIIPLVLIGIPLYMLVTHNTSLLEHTLVMYLLFMLVRSVQIILNKENRLLIEYTNPLVTLTILMLVYNDVIPKHHTGSAYLYILAYNAVALLAYPKKTSSSSLIDDVILSHLIFYILK